jgi:histone-lysine N-methyltransferase MLL1
MYDHTLCFECGNFKLKGNFCPICDRIYSDHDYDTPMLECCKCLRWVHAACDNVWHRPLGAHLIRAD